MENIDNMGKNSLESLSRDNLTERGKKGLARDIVCACIALSCLAVGLIFNYLFTGKETVAALIFTVGFLVEGIPVFYVALKGIFTRNLTNAMEILVSIAIIACYFTGDLVLSILIPVILNIVHFFEERSIMGGRDVIEGLKNMQQSTAILLDGDRETTVDAKTLKIGQLISVKPGSGIPIDGVIRRGETNIDQKSLTGEPLPRRAVCGDRVYAGTVNIDGVITVEVEKEYVDTSFSKILDLLEKSEGITVPESRLIDRFMRYYIPFVLAVAAAVALVSSDISKAIAILVVSCPCGHMLVSSAPMIAALSVATRRGILIKNSKFIEELTEIDTVVFDKTGTLTEGNLSLIEVVCADGVTREELLSAAATAACASLHPVSKAVINAADGIAFDRGYAVRELAGKGMRGVSADGAHTLLFGNRSWICDEGYDCAPCDGFTGPVSYVVMDGKLLGCLCFDDTLRPGVSDSIEKMRAGGVSKTVMLTGDRAEAAEKIRVGAGIDEMHAQLLPRDKWDRIRAIRAENPDHRVLVVGDGINDALALKEADVGIAMGAMGSDTAIQSADIALMNNNLDNIPFVISLSKLTKSMIYQNLALSILISAVMITLSAFGVISALAGTILHNFGAFAVLINSARILRKNK